MPKSEETYNQLKEKLDEVLRRLEDGELDIESAESTYKNGMDIVGKMEAKLAQVENKITKLKNKFD